MRNDALNENGEKLTLAGWGQRMQWADFCRYEYINNTPFHTFYGVIDHYTNHVTVRHGELECQLSGIGSGGPMDLLRIGPMVNDKPGNAPRKTAYYITFMDERDAVMGTGIDKVNEIVDAIAEDFEYDILNFKNCCVPTVIGDNVKLTLSRIKDKCDIPIHFDDMQVNESNEVDALLAEMISRKDKAAETPQKDRFNLVGYHESMGRLELAQILQEAGAQLNTVALPEIGQAIIRNFDNAAVSIYNPNKYYSSIYVKLMKTASRPVMPPAPFGMDGAWKWLAASAKHMSAKVRKNIAELWDEKWAPLHEEWKRLCEEARKYRVCFVVSPRDLSWLETPKYNMGMNIPETISGMGFGLDFLIYQDGAAANQKAAEDAAARYPDSGAGAFSSPGELSKLLDEGRFHAVYTNYNFDKRITRSGKGTFSASDFSMGFKGAVQTQKRLLNICATSSFYSRYKRII